MATMLEAIRAARDRIEMEPFLHYGLVPATALPLRLPDGWRFPYDSFKRQNRVRRTMVILFVDQQGEVEVEWDDFAQQPEKLEWLEQAARSAADLPALDDVFERVHSEYPDAQVESVEVVWDEVAGSEQPLYWRVGILEGVHRFVVLVAGGDAPGAQLYITKPERLSRSLAGVDWNLGRVGYERASGLLRVNLKDLQDSPAERAHLRSQWLVWSCMARVAEFVEGLGYGEFGPHNVRVDYVASDLQTPGAAFDVVRGVPTITFLREGGWADNLSVALHEMGHALWALLYTRSPRCVDVREHGQALNGVQEGFADYLAATLLSRDGAAVEIGAGLDPQLASAYKLPRLVNGQPFEPPSADPHDVGRRWANLLWDFRARLGCELVDPVVLSAHVKPRAGDGAPGEPLGCYFESLKETARRMQVAFDAWDELADVHGIAG